MKAVTVWSHRWGRKSQLLTGTYWGRGPTLHRPPRTVSFASSGVSQTLWQHKGAMWKHLAENQTYKEMQRYQLGGITAPHLGLRPLVDCQPALHRSRLHASRSGPQGRSPDRWDSPRWLPAHPQPLPARETLHLVSPHRKGAVLWVSSASRGGFPPSVGLPTVK